MVTYQFKILKYTNSMKSKKQMYVLPKILPVFLDENLCDFLLVSFV